MDDKRDDFDIQGGERYHEGMIVFRHSIGASASSDDLEEPLLQEGTGGVSLDDSDIWSNIMMEETSASASDPGQVTSPNLVARYDMILKKKCASQGKSGSIHSKSLSGQKEALLDVSSRGTTNTHHALSLWVKDAETTRYLNKSIDKLLEPKRKTFAFRCQDKKFGAMKDKFSLAWNTKEINKEDFGLNHETSIDKFLAPKRNAVEYQCQEEEFGEMMDAFSLSSSTGEKNKEEFRVTNEPHNQWRQFNENNANGCELTTNQRSKKPSRNKTVDRSDIANERNEWIPFQSPSWTDRSTKTCPPRTESKRNYSLPPCEHRLDRHGTNSDSPTCHGHEDERNEWTPFVAPCWTDRSCPQMRAEAKRRLSLPSCEHRSAELARCKSLPVDSGGVDQEEVICFGKDGGKVRVTVTTVTESPKTEKPVTDSPKTEKPSPVLDMPTTLGGTSIDYSKDVPLWNESIPDVILEKKDSRSVDYSSVDETISVGKSDAPLATDEADFSSPTTAEIFAILSQIPLDDLTQIAAWIEGETEIRKLSDRCDAQDPANILAEWWDTASAQDPPKLPNKPLDTNLLPSLMSLSTSGSIQEISPPQSKSLESESAPVSGTRPIEQAQEVILLKSLESKDANDNKKDASNIPGAHEGVSCTLQNLLDLITSLELSQKHQPLFTPVQEEIVAGSVLDLMPQTTDLAQTTQEIGDEIWFQMGKLAEDSTRAVTPVESGQHTQNDSSGACESPDLFDVFHLPACGDNLQHGCRGEVVEEKQQGEQEPKAAEDTTPEDNMKNAIIEEPIQDGDVHTPTSESSQDKTLSGSPRGSVRKVFPRMRQPFPPSRDRELPSNKRGSQVIPAPPSEDVYPKKLEQQSSAPVQVQDQHNARQKSRWFSVRDFRKSFQRKRRDNGAPGNLESAPSSSTQTKKHVRFNDALVKIHEYEPEEEVENEEYEEIQTIFNYYFGSLAYEEAYEHGSYDEDEFSDEHSESRNGCYIGYVPEPPLDCHGFDAKGLVAEAVADENSHEDSHDSLEETLNIMI